jgi:hypothetical protein
MPKLILPDPEEQAKLAPKAEYMPQDNTNWTNVAIANSLNAFGGGDPTQFTNQAMKMRQNQLGEADMGESANPSSRRSTIYRDLANRLNIPTDNNTSALDIEKLINPYMNIANMDTKLQMKRPTRGPGIKPLTGKPLENIKDGRTALDSLTQAEKILQGGITPPGKISALKNLSNKYLGTSIDAEALTPITTAQKMITQSYQRAISGLALTDSERKALADTLPSISDSPEVYREKFNTFRDMLNSHYNTMLDTYELNQMPVSQFRMKAPNKIAAPSRRPAPAVKQAGITNDTMGKKDIVIGKDGGTYKLNPATGKYIRIK